MTSPFDALDAAMTGVVMDRFGESEAAILRPRRFSQYTEQTTDPARPAQEVYGIFSAAPGDEQTRGYSTGEFAGTLRMATQAAEFWLPAAQIAALPYQIAARDLIEFPDRAGAPVYSIARIQLSDMGDANLILASEDAETT